MAAAPFPAGDTSCAPLLGPSTTVTVSSPGFRGATMEGISQDTHVVLERE